MSMPENPLSPAIQALLAALPEMFPGTQNIPLKNIRPNPDNPGAAITEEQIKELGENMKARGLLNAIRVNPDRANPLVGGAQPHPDNFRIKANGQPWELGDFNFIVLTGENRYRAALWLKWETIQGHILNPTAEEAVVINHLDNDVRERGWWASYQSIENLIKANPNLTQREVGTRLKLDKDKVGRALRLLPLLNPASRAYLVGDSDKLNKGIRGILEMPAARLGGLGPASTFKRGGSPNDPPPALYPYPPIPPETQDLVYRTLMVASDRQMTEVQVARLVEEVNAGAAPESLKTVKPEAKPKVSHPSAHSALHSENQPDNPSSQQTATHSPPVHTAPTDSAQTPPTEDKADSSMESAHPSHAPQPEVSAQGPSWFWKWMVGIKFISQMRSKVKKGETLTTTEKMLVSGHKAWQFFAPARKEIGKLFKEMVKGFCESVKKALGKTAKSILDFVLPLIFIGLLIWGILAFFHFAVVSPLHWIENKIGAVFHHADVTSEPAAVPTPVPPTVRSEKLEVRNSNLKPKTPNSSLPTSNSPVVTYQPAVSFAPPASPAQTLSPQKPPGISSPAGTQYDLVTFETEIAAIPRNSIVKDYPLTPDETMPGDLAASRLQDLTNADKYTMKIGGDTQKIASVSSSNNTLMITFKSSDVFGNLVNGSNQPTFFWEDVNTVHINEISPQKNTGISSQSGTQDTSVYQCSLIVSGSKIPLTIQCARPEDLEHLVSTLEYFIRHSRLGHDAQPAGLPYPTQGLRFAGSENAVNLLWANSPADKAGLRLGDRLWSVGKVANEPQGKDIFEKSLQTLPATLFVVSPADWDNALVAKNNGSSKFFSPKLRKVILSAS